MDVLLIIKAIFGVVYFFFLPGFLLSYCVFKRKELDWLERIGISIGLSVVVAPLFIFTVGIIGIEITEINAFLGITFLNLIFLSWLIYNYRKGREKFLFNR